MSESLPPASRPQPARYATIDIGTNSVKMLIVDVSGVDVTLVFDQSIVTRLGEGMQAQAQRLREVPMRRTLDAIAGFVSVAQTHGVREIAAVGTAALRNAQNQAEFLNRVQERCGLNIAVIPGEEEARLSYLAVRWDAHWRHCARLLVIDIGGGSTEIIQGEAHTGRIAARTSVNWGAVKLSEQYLKSDPPTITQLASANHAAAEGFALIHVSEELRSDFRVVGVGGTLTNLGAMDIQAAVDPEALHGHVLIADTLEAQITRLASVSLAQRKQIPGLDPNRADIILGGAILLSQALAHIGSVSVDISTRGLRWGVLYDRFLPRT